jgi:hypothetical protein
MENGSFLNFQMLEEVLHSSGAKIQDSAHLFKKKNLQTPGNTSECFQKLFASLWHQTRSMGLPSRSC